MINHVTVSTEKAFWHVMYCRSSRLLHIARTLTSPGQILLVFWALLSLSVSSGSRRAHRIPDLRFLATHPLHECHGAASLLIQWRINRCTADRVPALLESTVDAGPLYRRHGFKAIEDVSMALEPQSQDEKPTLYRETCFLYVINSQ